MATPTKAKPKILDVPGTITDGMASGDSQPLYFRAPYETCKSIERIMEAETRRTITNVIEVLITEALQQRKQEGKAC